jgi:hypothetical protein
MRLSINIYSTSTAASMEELIEPCLETIDFTPPLQVSRTIGPANYLEIERRLLADNEETVEPVRQDISRRRIKHIREILRLYRQGSVLQVHYTFTNTRRIQEIAEGIAAAVEGWYFWSDASFRFGPVDLVKLDEDDEGQDKAELVDVSQCLFTLATDNFGGDPQRLAELLQVVPEMVSFRASLEGILGKTKLYLKY